MTTTRLNNLALNYCNRYVVSAKKLSEYLLRRIHLEEKDTEKQEILTEAVHKITNKMIQIGMVNDYEAASSKLRFNLRSGYAPATAASFAANRARVDIDLVENILPEVLQEMFPNPDDDGVNEDIEHVLLARIALKRRRRGPSRPGGRSMKSDKQDIGWLQRRGYTFAVIRKALRLDDDSISESGV